MKKIALFLALMTLLVASVCVVETNVKVYASSTDENTSSSGYVPYTAPSTSVSDMQEKVDSLVNNTSKPQDSATDTLNPATTPTDADAPTTNGETIDWTEMGIEPRDTFTYPTPNNTGSVPFFRIIAYLFSIDIALLAGYIVLFKTNKAK